MNVVHLGAGMIPVPPGDEPDGTEEYIYRLSHKVGLLGCNVTVIDVKAGEYQKQKRKESSARYRELWHPPLPHRYNHAFLQRIINFALLFTQSWSFAFLSALSLNRMLSRHEVDIIHPHFADSTLTAIFVNKLRGKPVCVIYDTHFPGLMTDLSWFQKLMTLNERLALKYADHVIVDTPSVKRRLVSVYHLEPAKITPIIQHGSFDEQEVAEYLLHKTKSVSEIKIVLCVSKISFTKNQLTVVKAVPKVIAQDPTVRFIFAGAVLEASYLSTINKFIADNNLSQWVDVRGEVTREDLFNLYGEATAFVFPSMVESQGVVLAEAMTFGIPSIASNIEPVADVANMSPGTIILTDPNDSDGFAREIIRLLRDAPLREQMSQKSKELARRFSWENMALQTLDLYTRLLKKESIS